MEERWPRTVLGMCILQNAVSLAQSQESNRSPLWEREETKRTRKLKGSRTPYQKDALKKILSDIAGPFPKLL